MGPTFRAKQASGSAELGEWHGSALPDNARDSCRWWLYVLATWLLLLRFLLLVAFLLVLALFFNGIESLVAFGASILTAVWILV